MVDPALKNPDSTVKVLPAAVFTQLDDGTGVLMNLDSKFYFQLNPTGARMWQHIEKLKKVKVRELFEAMSEVYDIAGSVLASDINEFLSNLKREKMIEVA